MGHDLPVPTLPNTPQAVSSDQAQGHQAPQSIHFG